mmetsp:Transcript_1859/g.7208  ORF Transcript_1859/g.7208 Transcript_1859/m.7208 type:complete len:261 (+) Transcript_1859:817-1599(+)
MPSCALPRAAPGPLHGGPLGGQSAALLAPARAPDRSRGGPRGVAHQARARGRSGSPVRSSHRRRARPAVACAREAPKRLHAYAAVVAAAAVGLAGGTVGELAHGVARGQELRGQGAGLFVQGGDHLPHRSSRDVILASRAQAVLHLDSHTMLGLDVNNDRALDPPRRIRQHDCQLLPGGERHEVTARLGDTQLRACRCERVPHLLCLSSRGERLAQRQVVVAKSRQQCTILHGHACASDLAQQETTDGLLQRHSIGSLQQ